MNGRASAAVVGVGALAAVAAPAVTAIGPVRRLMAPRLAGVGAPGHIALTFDDGPDPESTPAFLDLLARHGRRATFFLVASQVPGNERLVRRMVDDGHELAVHGWTHTCTVAVPPGRLRAQLRRARDLVEDVGGSAVRWYRAPYGVMSTEAHLACRELGLRPVLWTAWGRDWERSATPSRIVSTVLRTLRPGGTILLHDTALHARGDWRHAVEATDMLLSGALRSASVGPLAEHWVSGLPASPGRLRVVAPSSAGRQNQDDRISYQT